MRGQTTLDFALGVTVFLTAVVFTFTFAPTIVAPFDESGQQDAIVADRVADQLSQGLLGHPDSPYVLDRHCTVAFFERTDPNSLHDSPERCRFENGTLTDQLGIESTANVNITIEGDLTNPPDGAGLLYWDETTETLREGPSGGDDEVVLTAGDPPPVGNDATVTATRVASLSRHDVTITVVVW